jgi:hypothetical protein
MPVQAPQVLIVGSADPDRTDYDPKLTDSAGARQAAEQIGAELARRGCRIVVYSASPTVIESDVVRGFVSALKRGAKNMIEVRYPYNVPDSFSFPEAENQPQVFLSMPDRNTDWEASFFASLRGADGVLIIGGGPSSQAIGYAALAYDVPVMSVAYFGGAAEKVWLAIKAGFHLPTDEEVRSMKPASWSPNAAGKIVDALFAQCEARRAREAARQENDAAAAAAASEMRVQQMRTKRATSAVLVLVIAIGIAVWGFALPEPRTNFLFNLLLMLVGPVAGAGAALAWSAWVAREDNRSGYVVGGLGFVAGLVSSLLYLLAQFSVSGDVKTIKGFAIYFAMATGLLAGFTMDQVLKQASAGNLRISGRP